MTIPEGEKDKHLFLLKARVEQWEAEEKVRKEKEEKKRRKEAARDLRKESLMSQVSTLSRGVDFLTEKFYDFKMFIFGPTRERTASELYKMKKRRDKNFNKPATAEEMAAQDL